jgi:hypothetical protein
MLTRIFFLSLMLLLIALPESINRSVQGEPWQTERAASRPTPAPAPTPPPCPTIELTGPTEPVTAGAPVAFSVSTTSGQTYNWTIVNGRIIGGDGTSSIIVDTTGQAGQTVTATVEIGGLDSNCANNTASYSITVASAPFDMTTILGTVKDANGAVLSGAVVKAVKGGSDFSASGTTNSDGKYLMRPVQTGKYRVTASLNGYRPQILRTELKDAVDLAELNFVLQKSGGRHGGRHGRRP